MIISVITKKQLEEKFGKEIRYSSDFEQLAYSIEHTTKQRLSANTLKRLFGVIKSVKEPRLYTLDIIAQYLGFSNWDVYADSLSNSNSNLMIQNNLHHRVEVAKLNHGNKVEFQYYPNRRITIQYLKDNEFKVISSHNSKLMENDIIEVGDLSLHYPLAVNRVMRDNLNLGNYTAGKISGLTYLRILD